MKRAPKGLLCGVIMSFLTLGSATSSAQDFERHPFPVPVDHKYGSTTITEAPERIVSVGLTDQDALLALGIVPVATREWYGKRPGAIFPWAEDELGDAPLPEVLGSELDFERIVALRPDVIVGLYSGLTEDEYAILSQIAPTVAQPAEYVDWGIPWQELTVTIGRIVGQETRAAELVAGVEARFSKARANHPEFVGATGVFASTYGFPESFNAYHSEDVRGRFLTSLGFDIPDEIDRLAADGFFASLSREQLYRLNDLDVVAWIADTPADADAVRTDPLYRPLKVVREGRDLFFDGSDPVFDALNFSTVLSLPFAIDRMTPRLAAAVDGDRATMVSP